MPHQHFKNLFIRKPVRADVRPGGCVRGGVHILRVKHRKLVVAPVLGVPRVRVHGPELRVPVQEVGGGREGRGLAVVRDLGEHVARAVLGRHHRGPVCSVV